MSIIIPVVILAALILFIYPFPLFLTQWNLFYLYGKTAGMLQVVNRLKPQSWQKKKPDYACVVVTRCKIHDNWFYDLVVLEWREGEPPEGISEKEHETTKYCYLSWQNGDGEEMGDINELRADEYFVVQKLRQLNK
jgi:hypothetical protein